MGKRLPMVIMERSQSDLSEDKVSPPDRETTADEHKPNPQPSSVVDKNGPDKNKKQANDGKEDYPSNIKAIREFFRRNPITSQWFFNGIIALFTVLLTIVTKWQYDVQVMERRAAVYLGRQDGVIGEFLPGEDVLRIVLYFRNAGASAAQRTVIDTWPITTVLNGPGGEFEFRPPDRHYIGPSIPQVSLQAPRLLSIFPIVRRRGKSWIAAQNT